MPSVPRQVNYFMGGSGPGAPRDIWRFETYRHVPLKRQPQNPGSDIPPGYTTAGYVATMYPILVNGLHYTTMSQSGVYITPASWPSTTTPNPLNCVVHYPDDDFFDPSADTWAGALITCTYQSTEASPYGNARTWWPHIDTPLATAAEITREGRVYEFRAAASTPQYPRRIAEVTTRITHFQFDFGDENIVITESELTRYDYLKETVAYFHSAPITFEIPEGDRTPIRVRAMNDLGMISPWCYVPLHPVAVGEIDFDDEKNAVMDASQSFDPDGKVVRYEWFIGGDLSQPGVSWQIMPNEPRYFVSTTPQITRDIASLLVNYPADATLPVSLRVRDNDGLYSSTVVFKFTLDGPIIGSTTDIAGSTTVAANSGTGVQVSRFDRGASPREPLLSIPNAKNPSLAKVGGRTYVSYTDRASGTVKLNYTRDGGRSLATTTPVELWPVAFQNATITSGHLGVLFTVATNKQTKEVWFKRSDDSGETWDPEIKVGAITGTAANVFQKRFSGHSALIVTDGMKLWKSLDGGQTWPNVPITIWSDSFHKAMVSSAHLGVLFSVANKKNTNELWFKRSEDGGETWSTDVKVGNLTGNSTNNKTCHVFQKAVAGRSTLIATNGIAFWRSLNGGVTWQGI